MINFQGMMKKNQSCRVLRKECVSCKWGAETGNVRDKLGLESGHDVVLPGFASADRTHERKHPKHRGKGQICHSGAGEHPWVTGGGDAMEPDGCTALREAGDKALALVRLPGKKSCVQWRR